MDKSYPVTRPRSPVPLLLLLAALLLGGGCGGAASSGSLAVEILASGNPNPPEIRPPDATARFRLEILNPNGGERVAPPREVESSGSAGGTLENPDVPQGSWVARVSALDPAGRVIAHFQEAAQVNSGSRLRLQGYLRPGSAPEGLLFVANSRGASLSILRLTDGQVEQLPLPQNPEFLFTTQGTVYATTGGDRLVAVEGVSRNMLVRPFPAGGLFALAGTRSVVSFPGEGGIRFLEPSNDTYSGLYRTGAQASGISRQVGSLAWVANAGDSTVTAVDVPGQALGSTLQVGAPGVQVDQNDDGSRIYVVGGGRESGAAPFVRVLEPSGTLVMNFANQLGAPVSVLLQGGRAYVTDALRGELVVFQDGATPSELNRLRLGEGSPTQMVTDGDRLYVAMEASDEIAVVDLATLALVRRIRVGQSPRGMALLR